MIDGERRGTNPARHGSMVAPLYVGQGPSPYDTQNLAPARYLQKKFLRELTEARLPLGPGRSARVTDADIAALPTTVQRYLGFMRVTGRPRTWSVRARGTGLFRLHPDRKWMPCEAWFYDSALEIARVFMMRLRFGLVPVVVRDMYVRGKGRMLGRLLDTFSIVDKSDHKIATGELVTYMNDAILMAPSMLLGPETKFSAMGDDSFEVTLTDHGQSVSARVFVDEMGRVTDFSTADRYGTDPARPEEMVRARWSTPVTGWTFVDGRPVAKGGKAIWHFPSGDFEYADFTFGDFEFNVAPGAPLAR